MEERKIAFLGLGAMGSRMAARLVSAGHRVTVWNRSPEAAEPLRAAGAEIATSPREAAREAGVVLAMLSDDGASRAVWLDPDRGACAGLAAGAVAVEMSTVTPGWIAELARAVEERGASLLDAPVVGSRPQAEAGGLSILVGGDEAVLARVGPVLEAIGGSVRRVGPSGRGAALKLAVNAFFAIQAAALGELTGYLRRAGLEGPRVVELLEGLPVTSPAALGLARLMAAESHAPLFPVDLVVKDLGYALADAGAVGGTLPTTSAVREFFQKTAAQGHGSANITSIARLFA